MCVGVMISYAVGMWKKCWSDGIPAPMALLHKLNTDPHTEPSEGP